MNEISLLKQASLADNMGDYKLADNLYNKAYRLASGASSVEKAILESLEKLGLSEAEKALIKGTEVSFEKALEKEGGRRLAQILDKKGIEAVEKALASGDEGALREFIKLTGKAEEKEITAEIARLKGLKGIDREGAIKSMRADIQTRMRRGIPPPDPSKTPIKIDILKNSKLAFDWLKNSGIPGWRNLLTKLPLVNKILKGFGWYIALRNGVPMLFDAAGNLVENWKAIDVLKPLLPSLPGFGGGDSESTSPGTDGSGSGTDGSGSADGSEAAGTPEPGPQNNWEYTSPEQMYNLRMKAKLPSGVSQQEFQGAKAQEFVNANKGKFKSQRDFYNAAKGAGDENFANSVIALVKKDIPELPREPDNKA
jgi:hypothetical protein